MSILLEVSEFCDALSQWAEKQDDVKALALVGSHARRAAKATSDIDFVLLTKKPQRYLEDVAWARRFGRPLRWVVENWGRVQSLRVWYEGGLEVEFGVSDLNWASVPIDKGTRRVIVEGIIVLYEQDGLLTARINTLGKGCDQHFTTF